MLFQAKRTQNNENISARFPSLLSLQYMQVFIEPQGAHKESITTPDSYDIHEGRKLMAPGQVQ